jgi:hypothetical protein
MSTNAIINVRNLDISRVNLIVGQAKAGRNPSINIKYDGQNLQLRLPRMGFPGGVLIRETEGNTSYTLIGSLKGCDPYGKDRASDTDDNSKLYNFLLDLEDKIIKTAVENSVKWFGKKRSEEAVRDSFKPLMRLSADRVDGEYIPNGKYPPSVTIKVPVYDNRVNADVIDNRGNPMPVYPNNLLSVFPKGVEANMVVSGSIYVIAGGGFGVTWRLTYAQVFPRAQMTAKNVFADDLEQGEDETAPLTESQPAIPESQPIQDTALDIEVVDPDDVPAPAPAPAPSSAAGRKRRVAAPL